MKTKTKTKNKYSKRYTFDQLELRYIIKIVSNDIIYDKLKHDQILE